MKLNLPSLQMLLAFEATARHASFTKAAQELRLTQTAVSHQIKNLETLLGVELFIRQRNTLLLTNAAREYLQPITEAINLVASATTQTQQRTADTTLTVICLPTYAMQCLIPLLSDFQKQHPEITLHLATSSEFNAFNRPTYDVAIRYGTGHWADTRADLLQHEEIFPVCAPQLLPTSGQIDEKSLLTELRQIRTFFHSIYQDDWPAWLNAAGYSDVQFHETSVYHMQLTTIEAAVAGGGIAIGRTPLIDRYLATGQLVAPFSTRLQSRSGYYLTTPTNRIGTEKIELFREWALRNLGGNAEIAPTPAVAPLPPAPKEPSTPCPDYQDPNTLLAARIAEGPNRVALVDVENDDSLTFAELGVLIDGLARQLKAHGINAGDRVLIFHRDGLEKILLWLALWRLAAVACPIDLARFKPSAAETICATLNPRRILCNLDADIKKVPAGMQDRVLSVGKWNAPESSARLVNIRFDPNAASTTPLSEEHPTADTIAAICSTSGTTGEPKLVVYDHAAYWLNGKAITEALELRPQDKALEYRSFDWFSPQILCFMPFLQCGLTLHVAPRFSRSSFSKWVAHHKITVCAGVPAVINLLLQHPEDIPLSDLSSLRFMTSSTAPLPMTQWIRFEQTFRVRLVNIYGSSEAGWICSNRASDIQIGTVGTPVSGVTVSIIDNNGYPCAPNEVGHIITQGPGLALGLLTPSGDITPIRGKTYSTNDMGWIDKAGRLRVQGRSDDIIVRGGVKISPREIEDILHEHPEVHEAVIIGVPDDIYGHAPVCFFVPRASFSSEELLAYCKRSLPHESVPIRAIQLDTLPRNARGKVMRSTLREQALKYL